MSKITLALLVLLALLGCERPDTYSTKMHTQQFALTGGENEVSGCDKCPPGTSCTYVHFGSDTAFICTPTPDAGSCSPADSTQPDVVQLDAANESPGTAQPAVPCKEQYPAVFSGPELQTWFMDKYPASLQELHECAAAGYCPYDGSVIPKKLTTLSGYLYADKPVSQADPVVETVSWGTPILPFGNSAPSVSLGQAYCYWRGGTLPTYAGVRALLGMQLPVPSDCQFWYLDQNKCWQHSNKFSQLQADQERVFGWVAGWPAGVYVRAGGVSAGTVRVIHNDTAKLSGGTLWGWQLVGTANGWNRAWPWMTLGEPANLLYSPANLKGVYCAFPSKQACAQGK